MRVPDLLVRRVFEPLWDVYEGSVRLRTLRELRRTQWWPREKIVANQKRKLAALTRHAAATCPFYERRFRKAGIDPASVRGIEDLRELPLLTKTDVRQHAAEICSAAYRRGDLVSANTGGSTGVSLRVYGDATGREQRNAAAMRSDEWTGWRPGEPLAAVWGNPPVARTLKNKIRRHFKDRIIYLDTMHLTSDAIDEFLAAWKRLRPSLLFGHAHSLFLLAEDLRQRGLQARPTGVVATSMMLIEPERAVMEQVFGVPVNDRYGCEEVSLIACECEKHRGLHLNADHNIVEFLRGDDTPCEMGEDGRIVVTELINLGMPMIRYEVGDRGVPSARECACGRGLPLMESLTGRMADFLIAEDGARVAGISLIERTLTRIPGIYQMQFVQNERGRLRVNVVQDNRYTEQTETDLTATLRQTLGATLRVEIAIVDRIQQEANGKYRFAICNIK